MKKFDLFIKLFTKFIMGVSVLILSVVTSLQVIMRFIFNNPIPWGQDIIRLSFVWLVFYGGALCVHDNEHLNIDLLINSLNKKYKKILVFAIELVLLVFFAFLTYYGFIFTKTGLIQKAPYLPISMAFYYLSVPTSSLIMIYFQIEKIIKIFNSEE